MSLSLYCKNNIKFYDMKNTTLPVSSLNLHCHNDTVLFHSYITHSY